MTLSKEANNALKVYERASKDATVYVFIKDNELHGRLTVRNVQKSGNSYIVFFMYGHYTKSGKEVAGYQNMHGWGYDRELFGINYVLSSLVGTLKEELNIDITECNSGAITNLWYKDFERAGYTVIQAL